VERQKGTKMAKRGEIVDLEYDAVLFSNRGGYKIAFKLGHEVFIPSKISEIDEDKSIITVPTWFAEKEGLEDYAV
jgi:hypothetical protein